MKTSNCLQLLTKKTNFGATILIDVKTKTTLPDLPYDYGALEPIISADIIKLHHGKHHQAYVNNLNISLEKLEEAKQKNDVKVIIQLEQNIRFNRGGHVNHSIYWQNLAPIGKGGEPKGQLLKAINDTFGSLEKCQEKISSLAVGVQGSGWSWLCMCPKTGALNAVTTANQEILEETTGLIPLFTIDVWEHAYYLQYKNVRPDYCKAIWKIANWNDIERRFLEAKSK
ncbi:superoxide dismutase [Mn] 1, mitochondrial-like protein 1 [Sarcoptes scabiei]|uniref:Superoxide dismutase n=1 Tax=Sarcoptes scabiei TaxID=52283 RepID=A0A132ACF4_SARSC|nr:superoxide dismutase [Mn] 1, mitochondrial-like protein 1 [Sarcoptes scabiei]